MCPFEECTTIASTMRWLVWKERELGHSITHVERIREYRLQDGTLVDGYYELVENGITHYHVLQFHGCFWHGCPSCFKINHNRELAVNNERGDTIDLRYERTIATTYCLRRRRYTVIEKWECAFDREMMENRKMREFLQNHPMIEIESLNPHDVFYGGRMGNIVTRYEITGTEKIRYVDVCSLYPYVLKTEVSPIGHPTVTVCYDPNTQQGGLFTEYINTFLKLKQEASEWPSKCEDDVSKEQYLRDYEKTKGVVLDKQNIAKNPDLRSVAKLCLNSFWEKFGQQSNLPNTKIVKTQQRLASLLTSPQHEIIEILPVNDEVMYVSWRLREELDVPSPLTNVVIAAYTTA
ncbi:uncharacterized protein [Linepithema humile]|uniref:uncharacterized protein n=1 Tax=Linepithema humile TaxID=83485 RepID=UPI00351EE8D8